jgi:glycyl-tRNA synthetase alpha subunit
MFEQLLSNKNKNTTVSSSYELEMATGTRNPSTRRVLPDKEAGMRVYITHTRIPADKTYPQK